MRKCESNLPSTRRAKRRGKWSSRVSRPRWKSTKRLCAGSRNHGLPSLISTKPRKSPSRSLLAGPLICKRRTPRSNRRRRKRERLNLRLRSNVKPSSEWTKQEWLAFAAFLLGAPLSNDGEDTVRKQKRKPSLTKFDPKKVNRCCVCGN